MISAFVLGFLPVKDTDLGWHYRCGQEFWEQGILCIQNRFSYFLPNYQSYNPHFLYNIILALIYDHFGFIGVSVVGALLFSLLGYLFIKLLPPKLPLWLNALGFYTVFILSGTTLTLGFRSQIVTLVFFFFTIYLLRSKIYFLPLLMLIWVNSHIGFFVGLILIAFWLIDGLIKGSSFYKLGLVGLFSGLVTLVNPFGWRVYLGIWGHATAPMSQMIAEWVPPPTWVKLGIAGAAIFLLIALVNQRPISIFNLLTLIFVTLLALAGRRSLPFFYFIAIYLFLKYFARTISGASANRMLFLNIIAPLVIAFAFIPRMVGAIDFDRSWERYCNEGLANYPCRVIEKYPNLSGNIFATYEWGGFLIWQLPEARVFVDGRMPAWKDDNGDSPYQIFLYIIQARESWNDKLRELDTDYILISPGTFLDLLLQKEASSYDWLEIYRDNAAVLYQNRRR